MTTTTPNSTRQPERLLLRGGRVIDPANGRDETTDVLLEGGKVAAIAPGLSVASAREIDATGLVVAPGLIDIHVHLREPGREDEETIASGTRAAANGGFTTICPMPNTDPACDSATGVNYIHAVAQRDGIVRVLPIAAVTRGREGRELTEFGDLAAHGAVAFSDDGSPVVDANVMRRALEYTSMLGRPILNHSEIIELVGGGIVHDGAVAARLGLRGIPVSAESVCVARDIELAADTGGRVHICHVSTARACELIREAKSRGVGVTAEVCPHHLTLTEEAVAEFDTLARVAPPLRSEADRAALRAAIADGTLDCIATDHAPHTDIEKDLPFDQAPPGMIGLDFAFAQMFDALVATDNLVDLPRLLALMSTEPARVLGIDGGSLAVGDRADIVLIDLNGSTPVTRERILSKSFNTPMRGRTFRSEVVATIAAGRLVHDRHSAGNHAGAAAQ